MVRLNLKRLWPILALAWLSLWLVVSHSPEKPLSISTLKVNTLKVNQIEMPIDRKRSILLKAVSSLPMGDGLGLFYEGQLVCFLRVFPGGAIRIYDRKGHLVLWLSAIPNGGRLGILDDSENIVGVFEADAGKGRIRLYRRDGKVLFDEPRH